MKKTLLILFIFAIASITFAQSVDVKDNEDNSLILINDEGTAGSITIPDAGDVSSTPEKLINILGDLHWDGSALSTGSPIWTETTGSNIYYNSGNIGIGTTSPNDDLHVADHIRIGEDPTYSTVYGELKHDGGGTGFKINANAGGGSWADILFQTNGTTKMFLESGGNVGIGTTSPNTKLDVAGIGNLSTLSLAPDTQSDLLDGDTITPTTSLIFVSAFNFPDFTTLNATTAITDGTIIGQILILMGTGSTYHLVIPNNANTKLSYGDMDIVSNEVSIMLLWNGSDWQEISRSYDSSW